MLETVAGERLLSSDGVGASWLRSVEHKIDPGSTYSPNILTCSEFVVAHGPLERLTVAARDEIDRLFASIRHVGYAVLVCNEKGIVIDHRGYRDQADKFRFWGSWLGAVWSEDVEGTNGVGTCGRFQQPETKNHRGGLSVQKLRLLHEFVDENIEQDIDITMMASAAGWSRHHFVRAFKHSEGITPHAFLWARRVEIARKLLVETNIPLTEIALSSGFSDQSHFNRRFKRAAGVAPGLFRKLNR